MRIAYRRLLMAAFTLTALGSWAATNVGQTIPRYQVGQLTRAAACATSAYHLMAGESATMTVGNDGGWCWADTYERRNWHTLSASSVAVSNASRHGHVVVRDIENQEVRVAYQPEPGFAGRDAFTIHYDTDGSEKTFLITVIKQTPVTARQDGVWWSDR
jgi:hypothetical protein